LNSSDSDGSVVSDDDSNSDVETDVGLFTYEEVSLQVISEPVTTSALVKWNVNSDSDGHLDQPTLFDSMTSPSKKSFIGIIILIVVNVFILSSEITSQELRNTFYEIERRIIMPSTFEDVLDENDEKLVLVSGKLTITQPIENFPYGVTVQEIILY